MGRILVTGGAGFIGSHLCDALVEQGETVIVIDDLSSGQRGNLHLEAQLIERDIASDEPLGDLGRIDAIVHLAALISGFDSLSQPNDYLRVNLGGLLRMIEFAAANAVPRIVFASSSTIYGRAAGPDLAETTLPQPMSVYAATKLMGEQLLAMYAAIHGFSHCSLRLFNVYGPRQATDHPYANVTCKFSHAAAHGLPIDLYGDGNQSRDFVYVDDVVDAFLKVLPGAPASVYNIGTGEQASIRKLIGLLAEIAGSPLEVRQRPEWPNDIRSISADTSRAHADLGFETRTRLREGLQRTVDHFRQ